MLVVTSPKYTKEPNSSVISRPFLPMNLNPPAEQQRCQYIRQYPLAAESASVLFLLQWRLLFNKAINFATDPAKCDDNQFPKRLAQIVHAFHL